MIKRYEKFINSIINKRGQHYDFEGEYYEIHHILPKSLGGLNNKDNLIHLTPREHFIAHWMLSNELGGKMHDAFWFMSHSNSNSAKSIKISSKAYAIAKKRHSDNMSGENNINVGRIMSEQEHINRSNSKKGENHHLYGKKDSDETRKKKSDSHKGLSPWNKGIELPQEHREAISRGLSKPIRITNLLTGEVAEFSKASSQECADYLGYKNGNSSGTGVKKAIYKNNGIIRKGRSINSYPAFFVEFI